MAAVDRESPVPLWAQLLEDLRGRLAAGEFVEAFPTDAHLCAEYGLSRHTVRDAVRRLQDEGVVSRQRGRGTFVTRGPLEQPTGALYSLFRSIEEQGVEQRSDVIDLAQVSDAVVARRLGLTDREPLVRLERVRLAGGAPLAHDTSWLPMATAAPLLEADFTHTALYDELAARCGLRPTSGTEWVHTRLPNDVERSALSIGARQPVFAIERLTLAGAEPLEWRETAVRGDRYTLVARWSPGSGYETGMEPKNR